MHLPGLEPKTQSTIRPAAGNISRFVEDLIGANSSPWWVHRSYIARRLWQ